MTIEALVLDQDREYSPRKRKQAFAAVALNGQMAGVIVFFHRYFAPGRSLLNEEA